MLKCWWMYGIILVQSCMLSSEQQELNRIMQTSNCNTATQNQLEPTSDAAILAMAIHDMNCLEYKTALGYLDQISSNKSFQTRYALVLKSKAYAGLNNRELSILNMRLAIQQGYKNSDFFKTALFQPWQEDLEFNAALKPLEPNWNIWTLLFAFMSIQSVLLAISIVVKKGPNAKANVFLACLLFCFAIVIASYVLYWTGFNQKFSYLNHWYHVLMLVVGPLFYLYLRAILKETLSFPVIITHLAPLICLSLLLVPLVNASEMDWIVLQYPIGKWWMQIALSPILKIVFLGFYLLLSILLFVQSDYHQSYLHSWFKYLIGCNIGYYLAVVAYYVLVNFSFFNPQYDYFISLMMCLFIFGVHFLAYIYPEVLHGKTIKESITVLKKYGSSNLTESAEIALHKSLKHLFEKEQVYLDNALSLQSIVAKTNSGRHEVSLVINKYFGGNFFEVLRKYRIAHCIALIKKEENMHIPLIQLAYDSGFNNKVTFNKAFKSATGVTPTEFRKSQFLKAIP